MADNEPEYIKALRQRQSRRKASSPPAGGSGGGAGESSVHEREALKWAREVAGRDPVVQPSVRGARCVVLYKPASVDGRAPVMLDGVASRDALAERFRVAEQNGQEVLGAYEVATARPLTAERKGSEISFTAGRARSLPKALSPEQMIRRASAQAEELAKTRKFDDRGFGGRGRSGGQGGGRGSDRNAGRGGDRGPRGGAGGGASGGSSGGGA